MSDFSSHSIYIHIPFCLSRCNYCDFNTYIGHDRDILDYVIALEKEIKFVGAGVGKEISVHTIYFGGGTPTLLSPINFEQILSTIFEVFSVSQDVEISIEANPGTLSLTYLKDLNSLGVNRISLGMQSSRLDELQVLGRQHTYSEVVAAVKWTRQALFRNINIDMIFGIPGQTMDSWSQSLNLAIDLNPEHFSLYALTIEPGTPLFKWYSRGLIPAEDTDLSAAMYEMAEENLNTSGYLHYEISNWARDVNGNESINDPGLGARNIVINTSMAVNPNPTYACRHNLQYWRNLPYLGFGAGAHGYSGGFRIANVLHHKSYTQRFLSHHDKEDYLFPLSPANSDFIQVDRMTEMQESMMMGLRLTLEGVSNNQFQTRFGVALEDQFENEIRNNLNWGLVEWVGDRLRLTPKGRLLGNIVFEEFI